MDNVLFRNPDEHSKLITFSLKIGKTMRFFEYAAFHRSVSASNKEKINCISGVKDRLSFTCFDWFELDMNNGLKVTESDLDHPS